MGKETVGKEWQPFRKAKSGKGKGKRKRNKKKKDAALKGRLYKGKKKD
jgi:hypothetical protein